MQMKTAQDFFSADALLKTYEERIENQRSHKKRLEMADFMTISRKCLNGTFRFSPYHEKLISKGRNKSPRIISIPTNRDKTVLRNLTELLQQQFPQSASTRKGNIYVHQIIKHMSDPAHKTHWVYRGDIQNFYDDIDREKLIKIISTKISDQFVVSLINHALVTPTIPAKTTRKEYHTYKRDKGVPQGLSISNILSNIYLESVDEALNKNTKIFYSRFVDDILMIGSKEDLIAAKELLKNLLTEKSLNLHTQGTDKQSFNSIQEEFGYLGYIFNWPKVSVRESSLDRMRQSILAITKQAKEKNLTNDQIINLLNIRITGAISDRKQYGWLFYYRHINDLSILHQLDAFILSAVQRQIKFSPEDLKKIKRFARAYFEIKHSVNSGYIHRYSGHRKTFLTDTFSTESKDNKLTTPATTNDETPTEDIIELIEAFDEDSYSDDQSMKKIHIALKNATQKRKK